MTLLDIIHHEIKYILIKCIISFNNMTIFTFHSYKFDKLFFNNNNYNIDINNSNNDLLNDLKIIYFFKCLHNII